MRRTLALAIVPAVTLLSGCAASEPLPVVSGIYRNPCCADLTVDNGTIETPTRAISFTLDRDKQGVVLLPDKYLGVAKGQGLDVDAAKTPMLIRYSNDGGRQSLTLPAGDGWVAFIRDR